MRSVFLKEINQLFSSPIAYLSMMVFLVLLGLFVWIFPSFSLLYSRYAGLEPLFVFAPMILVFLVPALTMGTFSEEFSQRTYELLGTKPLSEWKMVLGKFLAILLVLFICLLLTITYVYTVYQLGSPKGNMDFGAIGASYFGLFLVMGVFTSIGIFTSTLTDNQIVAFLSAMFLCFVSFWAFFYLSKMPFLVGKWDTFIQSLGIDYYYEDLKRGVINLKGLVYLGSIMTLFLGSAVFILQTKRW